MAATGQLMVLFVLFHVAGNATIFFGKLNAYAAGLHALPPLIWSVRLVMAAAVALHIYFAVQLSLENSDARPEGYKKKENLASSFAGRNMVWTGAVIGTFLTYHLLHFTFQVTDPAIAAVRNLDSAGRPDVLLMVVRGLGRAWIAAVYLGAMLSLWLHLSHGIGSSFQTWGLNGERSFPYLQKGSSLAAFLLLLAYASIPLAIVAGLLK
jgi:succinate dehydrogenase / fumarate reductase cytochrome b subunit